MRISSQQNQGIEFRPSIKITKGFSSRNKSVEMSAK
jgi:hypothetical protein